VQTPQGHRWPPTIAAACLSRSSSGDIDELAEREPLLAACYNASITGFVATGRRAGQRMMQMGVPVADHGDGSFKGPAHGFNLFAGKCISASDRKKREHVIRYMARPPLPDKYLSWTENGDVLLQLKRPWRSGTTHVRFTGTEAHRASGGASPRAAGEPGSPSRLLCPQRSSAPARCGQGSIR